MPPIEPLWDERGLVPAVVQDATSGAVLMMAWMNREALERTRDTGEAHFWSRSRRSLWRKGETSGHLLRVVELRIDCDADTILIRAEPAGPACHTGQPTCFYRGLDGDQRHSIASRSSGPASPAPAPGPLATAAPPPEEIAAALEQVLIARRDHATADESYTRSLLDGGFPKILAKIAEEHEELAAELPAGDAADVVHETADLLFHVMVGLVARRIPVDDVWRELARRFGIGGHVEKASRDG